MKLNKRVILIGATTALLILGIGYKFTIGENKKSGGASPPEISQKAAGEPEINAAPGSSVGNGSTLKEPGQSGPQGAGPTSDLKKSAETAPAKKMDMSQYPFLTSEVLEALPDSLKRFYELDAKAMRSKDEMVRYLKIMSSQETLHDVETVLLSTAGDVTPAIEKTHLAATAFLSKAIANQRGLPEEKSTIETALKIAFTDNINSPNISSQMKQVVAEDKAEIFHYILAYIPEMEKDMLEQSKTNKDIQTILTRTISYGKDLSKSNQKMMATKKK